MQNRFEINQDVIIKSRIDVARKAKFYDSGVVIMRDGKIVEIKGRALDYHIRQLKKELAALTQ